MAVDKNYVERIKALRQDPLYQEFLDLISRAEGTHGTRNNGYDRLFGFNKDGSARYFDSYDQFPDSPGQYRKPDGSIGWSNDAGRYQINIETYKRIAKKLGITDFSKESQDLIAIALLDEIKGFDNALRSRDYGKAMHLASPVWLAFGKRSNQFLQDSLNQVLAARGKEPVALSNVSPVGAAQSAAAGQSVGQNVGQGGLLPNNFTEPTFANIGYSGSFFDKAMADIMTGAHADPGRIPFDVTTTADSSNSVYGAIDTDPQTLVDRLFDTDPNTTYGLSFVGNGLRPTISKLDPEGKRVDMIEMPNGTYINAQTGDRMNYNGTVWIPPVEENTTEEVVLVDDLNDNRATPPASGVTLSDNSTPPNVNSVTPNTATQEYPNTEEHINGLIAERLSPDPMTRPYVAAGSLTENVKNYMDGLSTKNRTA